jgi:tRNA A-37 threonylcarbamoyl transferase component Bud32/tetratricopeptide (TPR) repeat protein
VNELETIAGSQSSDERALRESGTLTQTADASTRPRAALPEPQRGQALGRYVVLERLGAGAMGVVFAAYDPELDRRVALKLLHARHDDERARARLVREAQSLARVTHPRVIAVHDVGVHEGRVFLAMEYVAGMTLRAFMAEPAHSLEQRLAVLRAAGEGLAAVHRAGLVHRDFKPDNVMIAAAGEVKVMDFGLARSREGELSADDAELVTGVDTLSASSRRVAPDLTQAGAMIGTPAYMAPESLAGLPADARSDQFAFAVTCHEALYGVRPFGGATVPSLAHAIASGRIVDPPKTSRVPSWLRRVILRGLTGEPDARWPDLDAFVAALADDPIRKRRRRVLTGASVGLSALGGAALAWALLGPPAHAQVCSALVPDLEGRWGAVERERVARALAEQPTSAPVLASLDAYAREWDAARRDSCEQTHVAAEQSERVDALRRACLDQRAVAFEQLVVVLAAGESLERALEAASALPDLSRCSDITALELEPPPPRELERRREVERVREALAGLGTQVELDRAALAVPSARARLAEAEQLEHPPLVAEARLTLARALLGDDRLEPGIAELRRAYFDAMACGHARVQAEAAGALVYAIGYQRQDHRLGREWGEHALASAARLGDADLIAADIHHALGVLLLAAGDLDGSLAAYTHAYELRKARLLAPHPDLARSLYGLATVSGRLGRNELALELHRESMAMTLALYGPDHSDTAGSHNNIAIILSDLGRLDEAARELELGIAILDAPAGPRLSELPRMLTNLADVERRRGRLARARELEQRSLALRRESVGDAHPEVADSILGLARIELDEGDLDVAAQHARDGLARLRRDFAPGHPEILAAGLVLAEVLAARDARAEARCTLVELLEQTEASNLGPERYAEALALVHRLHD